ncbi:MAG: hypothetical protein K2X81_12880 [Candidatus Obscuribacterales bacterium]|nr:hypothetical protein [Candidatus Obscuribacterales bacterium]
MEYSWQWLSLCGLYVLVSASMFAIRRLLLDRMKQIAKNTDSVSVAPAELAFLLRPDDLTHCMVVTAVDLLQKGVKSPSSLGEEVYALEFKQEIWRVVTEYIKTWSEQKTQALLPELKTRSPVKILGGLWRVRIFILESIKGFYSEFIKDPLHIRKYFSVSGLLRLLVSLLASNLKNKLGDNVRSALLLKRLLVDPDSRQRCASRIQMLAILHIAVSVLLFYFCPAQISFIAIVVLVIAGLSNAMVLRGVAQLSQSIPFFEEVNLALKGIKRDGARISVLRFVIWVIEKGIFLLLSVLAVIVLIVQTFVLFELCMPKTLPWYFSTIALVAYSANSLVILDAIITSAWLANTDQVTSEGDKAIARCHARLRDVGPIKALSNSLADPEYNEELSELVALYGIETLVLLA